MDGQLTCLLLVPLPHSREPWARGQPDGAFGGEDCGELRAMFQFNGLNDYNCSNRIQWICEKLP